MKNQEIKKNIELLKEEISIASNLETIKLIRSKFISKSDFLNDLKNHLSSLPSEEKKEFGKIVNQYIQTLKEIIDSKEKELQNKFEIEEKENPLMKKQDFLLKELEGKLHPLTLIKNEIDELMRNMGYHSSHGVEIEETKYNFDVLNIPLKHPSRNRTDTFYLNNKKILRTHCTNMTAHNIENMKTDSFKSYSIGYVFRNDDNDARHSFQFNQIDLFGVGPDMSISSLKWTIDNILKKLFGQNSKTRYRVSYFPFTEPSYEVDVTCPSCQGKGCSTCSKTGMLEILGSGMLHKNVFLNLGKDPKKYLGIAAGIGLERLAMIKWKISDIRNFYENDLSFLRSIK